VIQPARIILFGAVVLAIGAPHVNAQTQRTFETKFFRVIAVEPAQQARSELALDETVKVYCAAWGEPDVDRRRQMLERVWAPDGTYTDPNGHSESREALIDRITRHLQKYPNTHIVPSSQVDLHHGMLRFTWKFVSADGKILMEGIDFGEVAPDGKLKRIVGFFGPVKANNR
jgi:SnoaL-like domain